MKCVRWFQAIPLANSRKTIEHNWKLIFCCSISIIWIEFHMKKTHKFGITIRVQSILFKRIGSKNFCVFPDFIPKSILCYQNFYWFCIFSTTNQTKSISLKLNTIRYLSIKKKTTAAAAEQQLMHVKKKIEIKQP